MLIDVREDDEWGAGHAPGAVHVRLGDLDPAAYTSEQILVVVCRSGARSSKAVAALTDAGRTAHNLAGGMKAWASAGQSVIRDDGTAGSVI
jgi:rhodanese-related sulfurtransferase